MFKVIPANQYNSDRVAETSSFKREYNYVYKLSDKVSGLEFIGRLFNADRLRPGCNLFVDVMAFAYDYSSPLVDESYLAITTACPDTPILSISLQLTSFNKHQLKQLKSKGLDYIADSLLRALQTFDINQLMLGGGSMGGTIAARMAAKASAYGYKLSLLSINAPAGIVRLTAPGQVLRIIKDHQHDRKLAKSKQKTRRRALSPKNRLLAKAIRQPILTADLLASFDAYPRLDFWVYYGDKDRIFPARYAQDFYKLAESEGYGKNLHFLEVKDYGHFRGRDNWALSYMYGLIIGGELN